MSWFSELLAGASTAAHNVEQDVVQAVQHTQLDVKIGAGGVQTQVTDTRTRQYLFWGLVAVAGAFVLGHHLQ